MIILLMFKVRFKNCDGGAGAAAAGVQALILDWIVKFGTY